MCGVPDEPTRSAGGDEPMTITEICDEHGVSRQTLHKLRADPESGFPQPLGTPGSTRPRYSRRLVAEFFEAHPLRPGRRTDLERPDEQ